MVGHVPLFPTLHIGLRVMLGIVGHIPRGRYCRHSALREGGIVISVPNTNVGLGSSLLICPRRLPCLGYDILPRGPRSLA